MLFGVGVGVRGGAGMLRGGSYMWHTWARGQGRRLGCRDAGGTGNRGTTKGKQSRTQTHREGTLCTTEWGCSACIGPPIRLPLGMGGARANHQKNKLKSGPDSVKCQCWAGQSLGRQAGRWAPACDISNIQAASEGLIPQTQARRWWLVRHYLCFCSFGGCSAEQPRAGWRGRQPRRLGRQIGPGSAQAS